MAKNAFKHESTGTHKFAYDYATSGHPGLVLVSVPYIVDHSVNYTYDAMGRRTGMQLKNDGTDVVAHGYTYDVRNRLATVGKGVHTAHYTRQPGTGLLPQTQIKDASNNVIMTAARTYFCASGC